MSRVSPLLAATLLLIPLSVAAEESSSEPARDPVTGFVLAEGWQLVRTNCTACHSSRLVTQQHGDADFWRETIRRMQRDHNLWDLEPNVRQGIVDYLSTHYAPRMLNPRRAPLSPDLMPDRASVR